MLPKDRVTAALQHREPDLVPTGEISVDWEIAEAAEHYRTALADRPQSANLHNNLGSALRGQGRVEEAIAEFERARIAERVQAGLAVAAHVQESRALGSAQPFMQIAAVKIRAEGIEMQW